MKSLDEGVEALAAFGFTPRQAHFLTLVMRHTGLCLPRQYATFAGTAYGRHVGDFFTHLVDEGWASSWACVHNRARLYHVHHKALYRAIGDPDSRFRRAVSARGVRPRIERLDALLSAPSVRWFATVQEYSPALAAAGCQGAAVLLGRGATWAQYGDRAEPLVGIDHDGRITLLLLVTSPDPTRSATLVRPLLPLLRRLPRWTSLLRLTFERTSRFHDFTLAVADEMEPLSAPVLADLRWYFSERRQPSAERARARAARLADAAFTYRDPRYEALYQRWLELQDALFDELSSTVLQDALKSGAGHLQCRALGHTYHHLDPLLRPRRSRSAGVEEGDHTPNPVSTPSSTGTLVDGPAQTGGRDDAIAPRIRRVVSGLRIGGRGHRPARRTPTQPSLFTSGGEERA